MTEPTSPARVEPRSSDAQPPATTQAGRGVLWMTAAKVLFVLLGFVVQFGLPRVLGSTSEYGLLSSAMALVAILTNALTASMVQTTSKRVAEEGASSGVARRVAGHHALVGLVLAGLVGLLAPWLGEGVLHDAALVPLLRAASLVVASYAVYATAIGALNGAQRFDTQARLDATFSVVRTAGLVLGAWSFGHALSAMTGFAASATTMAIVGTVAAGLTARGSRPLDARGHDSLGAHLALLAPIALYQLVLNGLLQLDIELLKIGATLAAERAGIATAAAAELASHEAGLYRASQTLAFVPYQLLTSVTLVLFPVVAKAASAGDEDAVARSVRGALRFSTLGLVGLLAPLAGAAPGAIRVAFQARYGEAAEAVPILALGQVFFGLGVMHATVLVGRGHTWRTVGLVALGLAVAVGGNVAAWSLPAELVRVGTAAGTAAGCVVMWAGTGLAVRAVVAPAPGSGEALRVAKIVLAGLVAAALARLVVWPSPLGGIVALALGALGYGAVLVATGALGPEERALVARVLARHARR